MKDLILAAACNYSWQQIDVWALSLNRSGFAGICGVILYDDPENMSDKNKENLSNLQKLGFQVLVTTLTGSIYNQRFENFYQIIKAVNDDIRYALVTDIRDIYFQSDPMIWLEKNLKKDIYAVSEGMHYADEPWGCANIKSGFPLLADTMMDKCIYNVGVLAGKADCVADVCLNIAMAARSTGFQVADQSGYNVLLNMEAYKSTTQFGLSEDGFACMAGTFADPTKIDDFRPKLLEPEPKLEEDGVKTTTGLLYPVVHQYDRVPNWNEQLRSDLNKRLAAFYGNQSG